MLTPPLEERLKAIEPGHSVEIGVAEKYHAETVTVTIVEVDSAADERAWPAGIRETTKRGHAIRLPAGTAMPATAQDSIATLLGDLGLAVLREQALASSGEMDLVLVCGTEIAHFYAYDGSQKRHFGRSRILKVGAGSRLPDDYAVLAGKSVGIVGCGSLGSKVAAMLARAGVRQFTLVDDDVLFVANLVRNELGAAAIGAHKVDALRARLIEIAGTIDVTVRRVALGGQESADFDRLGDVGAARLRCHHRRNRRRALLQLLRRRCEGKPETTRLGRGVCRRHWGLGSTRSIRS